MTSKLAFKTNFKGINTKHLRLTIQSDITDFLMDQLDNGNEQNEEETPLHNEPMDHYVDGNEQNE